MQRLFMCKVKGNGSIVPCGTTFFLVIPEFWTESIVWIIVSSYYGYLCHHCCEGETPELPFILRDLARSHS